MLNMNLNDIYYLGVLIIVILVIYNNSLYGNFIWDDRAAVIKNEDVHGITPLLNIFIHDFWGKDISLNDSHKSYRPLTTITYRIDFMFYGLDSYGYHITNLLLYICSCISIYYVMKQWINTLGARLSVFLFAIHPIHVEAVTSIVGRADVLCGLCYCIALFYYTKSIRIDTSISYMYFFEYILYFVVAYIFASLSILSKEIGFTIVGMFLSIEVLEHVKVKIISNKYFKPILRNKLFTQKTTNIHDNNYNNNNDDEDMLTGYFTNPSFNIGLQIFLESIYQCFITYHSIIRILLLLIYSITYYIIRMKLHGSQMMYQWSIMENHVQLLPYFYERTLSYAQYHFWYVWKLIFPMCLCFDYGYACIPIVKDIWNVLNLLPLILYLLIGYIIFYAISNLRTTLIISMALLIIPLIPALNIFIPVGTLLAERLLFIPSIGFCMLLGELVSVDLLSQLDNIETLLIQETEDISTFMNKTFSRYIKLLYQLWDIIYYIYIQLKSCSGQIFSLLSYISYNRKSNSVATPIKSILKGHKDNNHTIVTSNSNDQDKKEVRFEIKKNNKTLNKNNNKLNIINYIDNNIRKEKISIKKHSNNNKHISTDHIKINIRFFLYIIIYILLLFISICFGWKVVSRNHDWTSEYSLFKSGLQVCPRSVKVLSNYALLAMAIGDVEDGLDCVLKAIDIYPNQIATMINAGVAYQKIGNYTQSIQYYRRGLEIEPHNSKIYGYLGQVYYFWSNKIQGEYGIKAIRDESLQNLLISIDLGFYSPSILHMTGSILLEQQQISKAIEYYHAALNQSYQIEDYYKHSSNVPKEDDINRVATYNQLGQAYYTLGYTDMSIEMYEKGLTIESNYLPIINNLGNIYREIGKIQKAREIMQRGIDIRGKNVPPAILNNLGLLELDANNNQIALELFEKALYYHESMNEIENHNTKQQQQGDGSTAISVDGVDVRIVMERNIQKAKDKILYSATTTM